MSAVLETPAAIQERFYLSDVAARGMIRRNFVRMKTKAAEEVCPTPLFMELVLAETRTAAEERHREQLAALGWTPEEFQAALDRIGT